MNATVAKLSPLLTQAGGREILLEMYSSDSLSCLFGFNLFNFSQRKYTVVMISYLSRRNVCFHSIKIKICMKYSS